MLQNLKESLDAGIPVHAMGCVSCEYYDLGHSFEIVLPFMEPIFSLWLQKG